MLLKPRSAHDCFCHAEMTLLALYGPLEEEGADLAEGWGDIQNQQWLHLHGGQELG